LPGAHAFQEGESNGYTKSSLSHAPPPAVTSSQLLLVSGCARADLLERCLLVELGYATREVMLLLIFCWMRSESQLSRTLDEMIRDMQATLPSSLGVKSIPSGNFSAALMQLVSAGIVEVDNAKSHIVTLRRDRMAVKLFLQDVLHPSSALWEKAGLTLQDRQQLSHLVR
jgi:hypothetical protein